MKIADIYERLNLLSPFENQDSWDNSGLLIGSVDQEVDQICVSLDLDAELLNSLPPRTCIITHHPLIFKALKELNPSRYPSNLIYDIIKNSHVLISMHTNIDKTHLGVFVLNEILKYELTSKDEHICYFEPSCTFFELAQKVKSVFSINNIRLVETKNFIKKAALVVGSGGDLISKIKADCFLSGDIKYHQALEAKENGLGLIDIGHFESECFFANMMGKYLENFPIKVIISNSKNPFLYR